MPDLRGVGQILGWLLCVVSAMMFVPAIIDYSGHDPDWESFAAAAGATAVAGILTLSASFTGRRPRLDYRHAFILIALAWVLVPLFGAVPFISFGMSFTDAVFESVSGITTTGSTVLSGLDDLPPGLLLWRALLQWIGGIGIIGIAVLILPFLRLGGMQLFRLEASHSDADAQAFTTRTIFRLSTVYLTVTGFCILAYLIFGMSLFDAVTHAMATISTGGYSTHDASFGYFTNPGLHWAAIFFMALGSLPFFLFIKALSDNGRALVTDQQVRGFLATLCVVSVLLAIWMMVQRDIGFGEALTLASFHVTSIITTTGFATDDYTLWGPGAVGLFLVLMFVGGCSGSTAGSVKIYRYQVVLLVLRAHLRRLYSPHRVTVLTYNGARLADDVPTSVLAFLAAFVAVTAGFTVVLSFLGLDLVTAYSASITAITNVGPGLGSIIGPSGNFETLPDAAKWVLAVAMLAGRLEVLSLLVFFDRDFWS